MKKLLIFLSGLWLVAGVGTTSASASYYSYDFTSGTLTSEWSDITTVSNIRVEGVGLYDGLGSTGNQFSGNFLRNESGGYGATPADPVIPQTPTTLTLTGLPAHNSVSLGFLLAVIDSWDGNSTEKISDYPVGPDYFNVKVNGNLIFSATFYNISDGSQSYSGAMLGGARSQRGFNSSWLDSAYDMGLDSVFQNISHTGDTLTVEWFADGPGWQGENARWSYTHDESWAIDNVRVDLFLDGNPVPLPPTALLLGSGLLGLGVLGFRKKRTA